MPGFAALFMEAGGAPPPVARRDRLSSVWHAGRETKRDRRASHLLPRAEEGTFQKCENKPTLSLDSLGFFGGWWCSTTGREARPALIRLARRSRDKERPARQPPSPASGRRDISEVREQTHFVVGFAGFFWRLVVLDHRSRGATGSHPSGTPVARQERPARQPPSPANGRRDGLGRGEC
jgi:hypothetical protein